MPIANPESEPLVDIRGVGVKYPRRGWLFRDLSFEVNAGSRIAIVGPSGSGKSTLLSIVAGWQRSTIGEVTRSIAMPAVAILHQAVPMLSRRSVVDNVLIGVRLRARAGQRRRVAMRYLEMVGLGDRAEDQASVLSGGECQRVCVARAFAQNPRLLVADEPTGQLDAANAALVGSLLANYPDSSAAVVVATHNPAVSASFQTCLDLAAARNAR